MTTTLEQVNPSTIQGGGTQDPTPTSTTVSTLEPEPIPNMAQNTHMKRQSRPTMKECIEICERRCAGDRRSSSTPCHLRRTLSFTKEDDNDKKKRQQPEVESTPIGGKHVKMEGNVDPSTPHDITNAHMTVDHDPAPPEQVLESPIRIHVLRASLPTPQLQPSSQEKKKRQAHQQLMELHWEPMYLLTPGNNGSWIGCNKWFFQCGGKLNNNT